MPLRLLVVLLATLLAAVQLVPGSGGSTARAHLHEAWNICAWVSTVWLSIEIGRNPSILQTRLVRPIRVVVVPPRPHHPASTLLENVLLSPKVSCHECHVLDRVRVVGAGRELDRSYGQITISSAVSVGSVDAHLTSNGGVVQLRLLERVDETTGFVKTGSVVRLVFPRRVDEVRVGVEEDTAAGAASPEVLPVLQALESVVDREEHVGVLGPAGRHSHRIARPRVVLVEQVLDGGDRVALGLVDGFDSGDRTGVSILSELGDKAVECVLGLGVVRRVVGPVDRSSMTRVVESVLRTGHSVQIDPYLQAVLLGKHDTLLELGESVEHKVGRVGTDSLGEHEVRHGNSHVVEPSGSDGLPVGLGHPCVKVILKDVRRPTWIRVLTCGPLVNDGVGVGSIDRVVVELLHEAAVHPGFKEEPVSNVDSTHFLAVVVKA